jgi:autotransporter-associated beta strand protein
VAIGAGLSNTRRWRMSEVSVRGTNAGASSFGILTREVDCDGGEMIKVVAQGDSGTSFNLGVSFNCSAGAVAGTNLRANGGSTGLYKSGDSTLTVRNSSFTGFTSVQRDQGILRVISSEIDGSLFGTVICVGDYNGTGAALANGTFGSGGCV